MAKMRLVRESTTLGNVSQGFRAFEHQSGGQLQPPAQHESVRR
jgi:hypothetical protein